MTVATTGSDYFSVNIANQTSNSSTTTNTRTAQTLSGFVGGLVDQLNSSGGSSTRAVGNSSASDFQLTSSTASNRISGTATVGNWDTNASATFKLGGTTGSGFSTSAFIDDKTYALRDRPANVLSDTTSVTVNSVTSTGSDITSATTMVAGTMTGTAAKSLYTAANVTECTCSFLTWGWWGGDVTYGSASVYNAGGRDRMNLASYVAGTLTTTAALQNLQNQNATATYNGSMIGNVNNNGSSYLGAGSYSNAWNFGSQTGRVTASFDGTSFSGNTKLVTGTVNFTNDGNIAGGSRNMTLNGAFFSNGASNPAAGQAGNFAVTGTNYNAAGTFKAQK
jgi:hypothetical protein